MSSLARGGGYLSTQHTQRGGCIGYNSGKRTQQEPKQSDFNIAL